MPANPRAGHEAARRGGDGERQRSSATPPTPPRGQGTPLRSARSNTKIKVRAHAAQTISMSRVLPTATNHGAAARMLIASATQSERPIPTPNGKRRFTGARSEQSKTSSAIRQRRSFTPPPRHFHHCHRRQPQEKTRHQLAHRA